MSDYPTIDPRITGAPPERHAARVVAEMVKWLVGERARLTYELMATLYRARSRFGSPIAQRRLAARLRKAGGGAILDLRLRTGKRGNFVLAIVEWFVFDPLKFDTIVPGDAIPEKPWLECTASVTPYKRRDEAFDVRLFLMTHHAMQRLAERCGARTPFDLLDAMGELWRGIEQQIDWEDAITRALDGSGNIPMQRPEFVPVAGGKAVFEWDESRGKGVLIVTTILDADMKV